VRLLLPHRGLAPPRCQHVQEQNRLAGGATVFKGANGVWTEEREGAQGVPVEEDVYVWLIVIPGDAATATAYRGGINGYVATMMASLSECDLSLQREFMFTKSLLTHDRTLLALPTDPGATP